MSYSFGSLEEYKTHFAPIFAKDLGFSRKFAPQADYIILRNASYIDNHELHTTERDKIADSEGRDRTLRIPPPKECGYGVRIRRVQDMHYWDFTVDEKEWMKETYPSLYFFGYGELDRDENALPLASFILFNYRAFRGLGKAGVIPHTTMPNKKHSRVWFLCFPIDSIFQHNLAIDWGGTDPKFFKESQKQRHLQWG